MSTAERLDTAACAQPEIVTAGRQLDEIVDDAVAAIVRANDPPELYMRAGEIVRVVADEDGHPIVAPVDDAAVLERLYAAASWWKHAPKGGLVAAEPRRAIATATRLRLLADARRLPPLAGIVTAPTLRRDGTILDAPGYDPRSRLVLAPEPGLEVPGVSAAPDARDLADAVDWIDGVLQDFPFAERSDRATAYSIVLSIVMREAIVGCVPLYVVTARQQGTGKGLLTHALVSLATGRPPAMSSMPDGRGAEDELRKRILTILRAGRRVAVLDNVTRPIDSPSLAALVTAERWVDRVLGVSAEIDLRNPTTWIVTGNNVGVRGDFLRRVVWCRLDAQDARPWQRTGFRHVDLAGYVASHRGPLLGAALTIARAWYSAGCPEPPDTVPTLGGFSAWRRAVGGALAHAGVDGLLGAAEQMWSEADDDAVAWAAWLAAWRDWCRDPVPVAELLEELRREGSALATTAPAEVAAVIDAGARANTRLGHVLRGRQGRRHPIDDGGSLWIEAAGKHQRTRAVLWEVRS